MSLPHALYIGISILTPSNSDGATPAEKSKQILSVIPILPGQTFEECIQIPPTRRSRESARSGRLQDLQALDGTADAGVSQVPPLQVLNPNVPGNDLIDFGQNETSVPVQVPAQAIPVNPAAPVPVPIVTRMTPASPGAPVPVPPVAQAAPVRSTEPVPVPPVVLVNPTPLVTAQGTPVYPTQHVPLPADLLAAQVENGGHAQKHMEATLAGTATASNGKPGAQSPLLDFHKDLGQSLRRADSDTKSLDEFVDAEG